MSEEAFDVVIIGAGVNGLSAAWQLLENPPKGTKPKVCLLEQFPKGHTRGSSHGSTRITRYAYGDPVQTNMMKRAFPLWSQLERLTGEKLFINCGLLVGGSQEFRDSFENALKTNKLPYEKLSTGQIAQRFPSSVGLGPSVYDPNAGVLLADRCMDALRLRCEQLGCDVRYRSPVTDVHSDGKNARILVDGHSWLTAKSLILTPGPWAGSLLAKLGLRIPLETIGVTAMYWREKQPSQNFDPKKFPTLMFESEESHVYGIPAVEYPHTPKIAFHDGIPIDPDLRDADLSPPPYLQLMNDFIRKRFPQLQTPPAVVERCIYTESPDRKMILDIHPTKPNVFFCCGCSGSGFKMGTAVGSVLADLVYGRPTFSSLGSFSANRFQQAKL